ncbi:MAG: RNA polymerase sigma factor [Magnetospirillum sp.]|nr:RNA polymerase sigma factor [Magnetospirillum sp.]
MPHREIKRLFLAHRRELQAYLTRKLRDAEVAADLTQETFLRFTEQHKAGMTAAITHERSYLYRTAHNLAVDHVRQQQREQTDPVPDEALAEIPHDHPTPEQAVSGQDELERVRAALRELPERTRQVFALARIEGMTYRAVAERLGISDSSVQKHLAKAIQHVMQRLRSP